MDLDLFGLSLGVPFAPTITELPYQFFLLGIDGHHGLPLPLEGLRPPVEVLELCIPIRVGTALQSFAVGLKTIAEVMEESIHRPLTHQIPLGLEGRRQLGRTLAGPPQERHRVPTSDRIHQGFQGTEKVGIMHTQWLTASARTVYPLPVGWSSGAETGRASSCQPARIVARDNPVASAT